MDVFERNGLSIPGDIFEMKCMECEKRIKQDDAVITIGKEYRILCPECDEKFRIWPKKKK